MNKTNIKTDPESPWAVAHYMKSADTSITTSTRADGPPQTCLLTSAACSPSSLF